MAASALKLRRPVQDLHRRPQLQHPKEHGHDAPEVVHDGGVQRRCACALVRGGLLTQPARKELALLAAKLCCQAQAKGAGKA